MLKSPTDWASRPADTGIQRQVSTLRHVSRFGSPSWTYKVRPLLSTSASPLASITSVTKKPGGTLIGATLNEASFQGDGGAFTGSGFLNGSLLSLGFGTPVASATTVSLANR